MSLEKVSHSSFYMSCTRCKAYSFGCKFNAFSRCRKASCGFSSAWSCPDTKASSSCSCAPPLGIEKKKQASSCFSNKQLTKLLYPKCYVFIDAPQAFKSHFSYLAVVPARFPPWPGRKLIAYTLCFLCNCCRSPAAFSPLSWVTRPMPSPPCPSPTAGPDSCWVFHVSTSCGSSSSIRNRISDKFLELTGCSGVSSLSIASCCWRPSGPFFTMNFYTTAVSSLQGLCFLQKEDNVHSCSRIMYNNPRSQKAINELQPHHIY